MAATGQFEWHELHTRDRTKARSFYEALFGWHTDEIPMGSQAEPHFVCKVEGTELGAIVTSRAPAHVPSHWLPYIAVDDVDATAAEARSLGARVVREPTDIAGRGRSAVIFDPRGAVIGLRASAGSRPSALPQIAPFAAERPAPVSTAPPEGSFCWDELLTDDPAAATAFYADLLGYTVEAVDVGPAIGTYRILKRGDRPIAGVVKHPENLHPHWNPYIAVRDVDAATARALSLGASLYVPIADIAGVGRFSGIDDPTGAGMCLFRGKMARSGMKT